MNKAIKEYKQSLEDLKKINNELFYDELKSNMNLHLETLNEEAKKVEGTVQIIKNEMEKMKYSFEDKTEKATTAMNSTANQINTTISESIDEKTQQMIEKLGDIYNIFYELVEEQKQFVQKDFIEIAKAQFDINVKKIVDIHSTMETLLDNQILYIEKKENNWHELAEKWNLDLKIQIQNIEAQMNDKLTAMESLHKQLENSIQTFSKSTNETIQKGFEQTTQDMLVVKDTLKESEQNYQLAIAEQKESNQLTLSEQHKLQQEKLTSLEKMQAEQGSTMHKWLIGLSISQIVSVGAIAGLYFF